MLELKFLERAGEEKKLSDGSEDLMAYCAYENGTLAGHCFFRFAGDAVELLELATDPKDQSIADGLVRAAANFADKNGKVRVILTGQTGEISAMKTALGASLDSSVLIDDIFSPCKPN